MSASLQVASVVHWQVDKRIDQWPGVERAARLIGVGRSTMYTAVKRGDFETIQLNGRTVLLTLPLLERIGIDLDATARLAPSE